MSPTAQDVRALSSREQAEIFLRALFPDGAGFVELRAFPRGKRGAVVQRWHWREDAAALLADAAPLVPGHDVYVGVAMRRERGAGGKDGVVSTAVLWADLDVGASADGHKIPGKHATKEAALATLGGLAVPPTLVVDSGGGYHAYWELAEPLPLGTPGEQDVAEAALRRLCAAVDGDDKVCEVARILRLPGSRNQKTDPARPVTVLRHDRTREVDLEELLEELPPDPGPRSRSAVGAGGSVVRLPAGDREQERRRRLAEQLYLPCMQRVASGQAGWQEGEGHAIRLRAACHLRHYGLPAEAARPLLLELDPTIADDRDALADLDQTIASVYSGRGGEGYAGLGCEEESWTSRGRRCGDAQRAVCPLWAQEHGEREHKAALDAVDEAHAAIPEDAAGKPLLLLLGPVYDAIAAISEPTVRDACIADVVTRYRPREGSLKKTSVAAEVARRVRRRVASEPARAQTGPEGLRVPPGWRLEGERLYRIQYGPDGTELGKELVADRPPLLIGRYQDMDTGERQLECTFCDPPGRGVIISSRASWATSIGLGRLADLGLPVHAGNARALTGWIDAQETANADRMPQSRSTSRFGWHAGDLFVLGDETLGPGGAGAPLRFVAEGAGEVATAEALRSAGDEAGWCRVVLGRALEHPTLLLCVVAALATPIMEPVDAPVFLLELVGESSIGKTTAAKVALSAWGNPEHSGIRRTFWATTNSHERYLSAVGRGLPAMLDDTQNVPRPEQAVSTAYVVGNGQGKGRAAPSGSRIVATWRTVCFVTGERGLESYGPLAGIAARMLSFGGSPFGGHVPGVVAELSDCVAENHGHAGRAFVRWLLLQSDWRTRVRRLYSETSKRLRAEFPDDKIMSRRIAYASTLVTAATLLDRALPWALRDSETLADRVEEALVCWAEEQPVRDQARESYEAFLGHAYQHRTCYISADGAALPPDDRDRGERHGVWGERGERASEASVVKVLPTVLRSWAATNGYDLRAVLRQWQDRGWLLPGNGRHASRRVRMDGSPAWVYVVRLPAEGDDGGEGDDA